MRFSRSVAGLRLCPGVLAFLLNAGFGQCGAEPDAPDCSCFNHTGDWNPSGSTIQNVAWDTMGTEESCSPENGGKPYYQMVLGCNSESAALAVSEVIYFFGTLGLSVFHGREAWCSETISYWHREAEIPYSEGYRTWWHQDWQNYNVTSLKYWYVLEEQFKIIGFGGRGRWIEPGELDYSNPILGETIPVPGAYIATRGYTSKPPEWSSLSNSHSQMIDEMWIHRDVNGRIFKIEVTLLQGNAGGPGEVKDGKFDDLYALTPAGSDWIGSSRKIYGFGVDLDSHGNPIYDPDRLHYVPYPMPVEWKPPDPPGQIADLEWHQIFAPRLEQAVDYARKVRGEGPQVTCSAPDLKIEGVPDGGKVAWDFPALARREPLEIVVDFGALHPIPTRGIELGWASRFIPLKYQVEYMGSDREYHSARVPDLRGLVIPPGTDPDTSIPVMIPFKLQGPGIQIQAVRLTFAPDAFPKAARLAELRLIYDWGPWQDAEINPAHAEFRRGDVNADGAVDIGDAISTLGFLFAAAGEPGCMDSADANDDGAVDIGDAIYTLAFLFASGDSPAAPGPQSCGIDPTADRLGCKRYLRCRGR